MRLLLIGLLAILLELGWLAVWPLSTALSHSAAFTTYLLASYAPVARMLELSLAGMRIVMPELPEAPITDALGSPALVTPAMALAAVLLLLATTYLVALVLLDRGGGARPGAVWLVVVGAVVFQTTLLFLPGIFSQDVFSYIAYGRLAAVYELNPYIWPPSAIPRDAVLSWVAEVWRTYPAPYGPVWLDVQWLVARLFATASIAEQAMGYRLLGNVLMLANLGLLWLALGRFTALDRAGRTAALAALAWNPLVLLELSANAHNDVLMVTCSLLGLLLFARSNNGVVAAVGFALGTLVKYLSGVGLLWVGIAYAARAHSWKGRLLRLVLVGTASLILGAAVAWPWLELPDSLEPLLAETLSVGFVNSVPDTLTLAVADHVLVPTGTGQTSARDLARASERRLVFAAFALYVLWEARRVWSDATATAVARAVARSCLIYILLVSTSTQPWYFCLPLALTLVLGCRAILTQVIVAYSLLALPVLYLSYYLRETTPVGLTVAYGLLPLLPVLRAWFGPRAPSGSHSRANAPFHLSELKPTRDGQPEVSH